MEEPLDSTIEVKPKTKTHYKQWSFRMFIYLMVTNLIIAFQVMTFGGSSLYYNSSEWALIVSQIFAFLFFIAGIILTILSYLKKEERDYQYKVSVWGFAFLILWYVILLIKSN